MQVYPSCGAENRDEARFCDVCGAALAAEPARASRKTVPVLFCDVTGSTALGERIDPESLRNVMARYFETAKEAIERHGGTVEAGGARRTRISATSCTRPGKTAEAERAIERAIEIYDAKGAVAMTERARRMLAMAD